MHSKILITLALVVLAAGARTPAATAQAEAGAPALTGIVSVTTGYYHGCAVVSGGQARCWGWNAYGELGNGTSGAVYSGAEVVQNVAGTGPLTGVRQVAAGDYHSCALLATGQVRCWGDNSSGQLGNGSEDESHRPIVVQNGGGTGPLTDVVQLTAGNDTTCATLASGQARCWGDGTQGQIGNGGAPAYRLRPTPVVGVNGTGRLTGVTQLDTGYYATCARLTNGQARCWGSDTVGQLGDGPANPTQPLNHPVVVRNGAGNGPLQSVRSISFGYTHGCAALTDGTARCWGHNLSGKLGEGTTTQRNLPTVVRNTANTGPLRGVADIDAGAVHTCARLTAGGVRCWGNTEHGQVGNGALNTDVLLPAAVRNTGDNGDLTGVTQVHASDSLTCARLQNGQARCWGYGEFGGLGNGAATPAAPIPVKVGVAT